MPVTSPAISFGRNALAIQDDINTISVTHGGTGTYANTNDLKIPVAVQNRLITLEPNFWLLDGNYKFAPNGSHFGYMSTAQSDGSGVFAASVPQLSITFNSAHSTNELTLFFDDFSGDWCNSITIAFYDASSTLIRTDTYAPTSAIFKTAQAVSNFKRVDISFNTSNKATRYVRLSCINFDDLVTFSGADIKSAKLVEEIDPVSINLNSNTVEFVVHSATTDFSIANPAGFYANLRDNEPLDVFEKVNENVIYLGRFYLDKWESLSENEASFHAYDLFHLLENIQYNGGIYGPSWVGSPSGVKKASDLISDLATAGGFSYTLDSALNASTTDIYGWIPISNIREILQSICIAIGGYATCSRSKLIQFRKAELASSLSVYDYTITQVNIGMKPKLSLLPLITGVEITAHNYSQGHRNTTGNQDVDYDNHAFAQDVALGQLVILTGEPSNTFDYTGSGTSDPTTAVFTQLAGNGGNNVNSFGFNITTTGHLRLDCEKLVDGKKLYTQYTAGLPAGTTPNIIQITDETLIANYNASNVLTLVYNYYQQRYSQKVKSFAPSYIPGDSVYMDTQSGKHLAAIVERMETDLANGFVATSEIVGVIV